MLQSNHHHQKTNTKYFYRPDALPVNQQCQSTEGKWIGPSAPVKQKQCGNKYIYCVVEITAANAANVCTFAVMGDTDIDQTVMTLLILSTVATVLCGPFARTTSVRRYQ